MYGPHCKVFEVSQLKLSYVCITPSQLKLHDITHGLPHFKKPKLDVSPMRLTVKEWSAIHLQLDFKNKEWWCNILIPPGHLSTLLQLQNYLNNLSTFATHKCSVFKAKSRLCSRKKQQQQHVTTEEQKGTNYQKNLILKQSRKYFRFCIFFLL